MDFALELFGVTKAYKDFTLSNIDLALPSGCIMGFIGENGAGKTTTIKAVLDLIHRDQGSIRILGEEQTFDNRSIKEHLGVVLEESCFPEHLSAQQVGRVLSQIYRTWDPDKYRSFLNRFSLSPNKRIKEYSLGMKRKLSIAAALAHDSKLLLLDEATSGLDPVHRSDILDVFMEFIQEENCSIFLSSHILSDLEKVADYIAFLHQGKLLFSSEKDVLLNTYGMLRGPLNILDTLAPATVKGVRTNAFGVEALVDRSQLPPGWRADPATIEDIMLFFTRGKNERREMHWS